MGFINRKRKRNTTSQKRRFDSTHLNWMGGPSFELTPVLRLKVMAASCFFGEPQYYQVDGADARGRRRGDRHHERCRLSTTEREHLREQLDAIDRYEWRGLTPAAALERTIDEALDQDPVQTLQLAVELRQRLNIRTTPQVIMVRAARHPSVKGTSLIHRFAPEIMQRLDEPTVQMAYHLATYGKPIPSRLKRAWARRLERARPFELAKYRMEGREVNLYDVINVCHPASDAVSALMKGELKLGGQHKTWASVRSAAGVVTTPGEARAVWTKASREMGHMALLRNLRNLEANDALTDELLDRLVQGVDTGRQLPFRYYAAFQAMHGARAAVQDAIEECMERAFRHAPRFSGRVMSLADNSGSAHGTMTSSMGRMKIADIGNLMAVMTAKMADDGHIGIFGDRYESRVIRKKTSIFDELAKAEAIGRTIGGGTENGLWLFFKEAIERRQRFDHVFVYSDMQAGHGGLYGCGDMKWCPIWKDRGAYIDVPRLIRRYRDEVNPLVNVYLVQVAGYGDTLMPEFYDRTYILGGWSESVLQFADYMARLRQ